MIASTHVSLVIYMLVAALVVESEPVRRADRIESSEDYEDVPTYEEDFKEKGISSKAYYPAGKSKDKSKEFFSGDFNMKDFDSAEFANIPDDMAKRRKGSSFDWADDDEDDYDFSDFKDFPDDARESPSSGFKTTVPAKPYNHEYSITHPRSLNKKSFDFDLDSKEETEGAYSSKVQTPHLNERSEFGPLLMIPRNKAYKSEKHSNRRQYRNPTISADFTNRVAKKVKFDPEKLMRNGTNCIRTRKTLRDSDEDEKVMVCYECFDDEDEKSFERCSYESKPEEKKYSYESTKTIKRRNGEGRDKKIRNKRDIFPDDSSEVGFGFEDFNLGGSNSAEFFDPEFDEDDPDRRRSGNKRKQSQTDVSSGESCLTTRKNNMICVRCMNPSSNGLSEECSYESEPVEKSYEYSTKKSYGKPREPKVNYPDRFKRSIAESRRRIKHKKENNPPVSNSTTAEPLLLDNEDIIKINNSVSPIQQTSRQNRQKTTNGPTATDIYNNHFLRIFPEFSEEEVQFDIARAINALSAARPVDRNHDESASVFLFEDSVEGGNDYRRILDDFTAKDRNNCTRSIKDNLTCYTCKNGSSSHEECLQVSGHINSRRPQTQPSQDFQRKRYLINKVARKKFNPEEKNTDDEPKRFPRSVFRANRRQFESDYHDDHPEYDQSYHFDSEHYDPEYESKSHSHHVPFF